MEGANLVIVILLGIGTHSWLSVCGRLGMELAELVLRDQLNDDYDPVVLVIDDDPDVREGIGTLLESVNLQSKAFGSAEEFFWNKLPERVGCLVLDVRLPGLNGLDLQTELAKVQIDIPIIFITGHGDIPMSVKAMKGGAVEFLTKPFREQELLDAVRVALDRDRERRHRTVVMHGLRHRFDSLRPREREVMTLVVTGMLNKQVAAVLGISEVTVKVHRHNLMMKIEAKAFTELVRMADILGLPRTFEANDLASQFQSGCE
jgi:FixJ family two-component response regulator